MSTSQKHLSKGSNVSHSKNSTKTPIDETTTTPTPNSTFTPTPTPKRSHKHSRSLTKQEIDNISVTPPRDVGILVTQPAGLFNNDTIDTPSRSHKKTSRITSGKWSIRRVEHASRASASSKDRLDILATPRPTNPSFDLGSPTCESPIKCPSSSRKLKQSERARSVNLTSSPLSNVHPPIDPGPPPILPPPPLPSTPVPPPPPPLPSTPIPPPLISEELTNSPVSPQLVQLLSKRQVNRIPQSQGRVRTHERRNTVGEVPPDVSLPVPIPSLFPSPPPPLTLSAACNEKSKCPPPHTSSLTNTQSKKRKSFSHTPGMIATLESEKENSPHNSPTASRKSGIFIHMHKKRNEFSFNDSKGDNEKASLASPKSTNKKLKKNGPSHRRYVSFQFLLLFGHYCTLN